ncbi:protease complex subunit PrcB family protein [Kitasatospora sp. NPDC001540]|uniref:protease complex subunit PrcB family protein n=1 Tax=Kitasatospora sp. NPDC001540 TaxID=3364014 RepID=UPI00367CCDD8
MTDETSTDELPFRVLAVGDAYNLEQAKAHVLCSQAEFDHLRSTLLRHNSFPDVTSDVDWNQEMVIIVALGTRPSGGYSLTVHQVVDCRGTLTVHAREHKPLPGYGYTQALTHPRVIIAVPARPGPVELSLTVATPEELSNG